jgi:hypothetical protein
MKAIQTEYNGLLFRSRIEARWAYLFDLLKVKYEYEKEGYELPSGKYLPDFWLPQQNCWVEIKGQLPDDKESTLASELAMSTECPVYIFFGAIPDGSFNDDTDSALAYFVDGGDNMYRICLCKQCGAIGIEFNGRSDRLPCKSKGYIDSGVTPGCDRSPHGDKGYTFDDPRILRAYRIARQARFEHGETPSRPYGNIVDYDNISF